MLQAVQRQTLSSNSRETAQSLTSRSSGCSHSGLRPNQAPPGSFTASELFVRQADNPQTNGGVLLGSAKQKSSKTLVVMDAAHLRQNQFLTTMLV
jgi:hypothetical protein